MPCARDPVVKRVKTTNLPKNTVRLIRFFRPMKVRGILPQLNSYSSFKDCIVRRTVRCRVSEATCVGFTCQETFFRKFPPHRGCASTWEADSTPQKPYSTLFLHLLPPLFSNTLVSLMSRQILFLRRSGTEIAFVWALKGSIAANYL